MPYGKRKLSLNAGRRRKDVLCRKRNIQPISPHNIPPKCIMQDIRLGRIEKTDELPVGKPIPRYSDRKEVRLEYQDAYSIQVLESRIDEAYEIKKLEYSD